jgi:hypothetical protein
MLADKKDPGEAVEELFLAALSRPPTTAEKDRAVKYVTDRKNSAAAYSDVLWALINTTEFVFNH